MSEKDWLCSLEVCVSRQHCVLVLLGEEQKRCLRRASPIEEIICSFKYPQTEVGGDLVVSATSSVELAARVTNQRYQLTLHERMDVFSFRCGQSIGVREGTIENQI